MALLKTTRSSKTSSKELAKKANKKPTNSTKVKGSVANMRRLISITESKLAKYKDKYQIITDLDDLKAYIHACNMNGIAAIDTETTGLDVFTIDIAGICLYTPNQKPCYIPINHQSYVTKIRVSNQLEKEQVQEAFKYAVPKWIMHNADYDIRTMRHTMNIYLECYWDTYLAAKLLDENESRGNKPFSLKQQHMNWCESFDKEVMSFDGLFNGIVFTDVPIKVAYLYAAGDPLKTYQLYESQLRAFERPAYKSLLKVFLEIEMPIVSVVADMEDYGMCFDFEKAEELQEKYHAIKETSVEKAYKALAMYDKEIENYKLRNLTHKLSDPINLGSPSQLATLFYDIIGVKSVSKKSPRGTGEEILKELAKTDVKNLCEAILELRGVEKLLSTYIDKMPELARRSGRVHCRFNQLGTKTGRFSSSDPNTQNIPSRNKDIRQMFKASEGCKLISADYSKQEIFIAASVSKDEDFMDSCKKPGDIYSSVAAQVYNVPYEECCEFRSDGTKNPQGKERRSNVKAIVLGILYSKEVPSIASDLGITKDKAQKAYDSVLRAFPRLKDFMKESQDNARNLGYVETAWGRKRHLPDMQLEPYEFTLIDGTPVDYDPLDFDSDEEVSLEVPDKTKKEFIKRLEKAWGFMKKNEIIQEAKSRGIKIKDNNVFIQQATRQCVNSRVQGSAGDMMKRAMIELHRSKELRDLGFKLLLTIHDEVIGEAPIENVEKCNKIIEELMIEAGKPNITVPMRIDIEVTTNWNGKD